MAALKELDLEDFIPELEQFMVEHKKYEATKKNEKDLNKKLKGARGADGKYVAPVVDGDVKEDEKDDTDGEANVTNILLDLSQDGPDKAGKPPIRDCLCRDGNSSSGFAHSCALYKKITQ